MCTLLIQNPKNSHKNTREERKEQVYCVFVLLLDHSQNYALHFICITFHWHYIKKICHVSMKCMPRHNLNVMHYHFHFMKCKCNAKSLVQQVFCIFPTTFSPMPSRHPPASTRHGKGLRELKQQLY